MLELTGPQSGYTVLYLYTRGIHTFVCVRMNGYFSVVRVQKYMYQPQCNKTGYDMTYWRAGVKIV